MLLFSIEEYTKIAVEGGSLLLDSSNLFAIERYQLMRRHQTQCLLSHCQLVGIYFYMPIFSLRGSTDEYT